MSYRKLGLTSGIADDDAAEASGVLLCEQEHLKLETLPSFSAIGDGWEKDCSSVCGFSFIRIYTYLIESHSKLQTGTCAFAHEFFQSSNPGLKFGLVQVVYTSII